MARTRRVSMTVALVVCMVGTQLSGTLSASGEERSSGEAPSSLPSTNGTSDHPRLTLNGEDLTANPVIGALAQDSRGAFNLLPARPGAFAEQVYQGPPIPMRRDRDASVAAMMIGAIASITGAAVLIYANRPECSVNPFAGGCGYGTKVVGGAVLSGGIVGLFVGALTWR